MTTWARQLYEHDYLAIAKGESNNYSAVHKFGANFDLDAGTVPETIWTNGGLYPWSALDNPQIIYVKSDDSNDTSQLEIIGLDENWNEASEIVVMSGTTPVATISTFRRVYRMIYNHTSSNEGVITAHAGSSGGTVVATIDVDYSQTLMCVYTVPAGYTAYLVSLGFTAQKGKDAQVRFYSRGQGESFKIKHIAEVYAAQYNYMFVVPLKFPEKSDLDLRSADVESSNTRVTANFDLILVKNTIAGEP